jgi:hypothetical protein
VEVETIQINRSKFWAVEQGGAGEWNGIEGMEIKIGKRCNIIASCEHGTHRIQPTGRMSRASHTWLQQVVEFTLLSDFELLHHTDNDITQ